MPLQASPTDARGYVIADLSDPDLTADISQYVVCAVCCTAAISTGLTQVHETPVGPSDKCTFCNRNIRGLVS